MGVDIAVLTETKLNHGRHTTFRFGYSVCASVARSSSQGGVAVVFNRFGDRFNMNLFRVWGPDVASIALTSGRRKLMLVGVYISPTAEKEVYEATIEGIYKAVALAVEERMELVVMGDINVDLRSITNSRLDILQGVLQLQDDRRSATVGALSSLGLEDTGQRFRQRKRTGILTWSQSRKGKRVRSVCDYVLMEPASPVLTHRIRWVPGCSTDHRMVYVDIPAGDVKLHRKRKWRLQRWPIPQRDTTKLGKLFGTIKDAVPKPEQVHADPPNDWISDRTWERMHAKALIRRQRKHLGSEGRKAYRMRKRKVESSIQEDRNRRIADTLEKAEAMIDSDPKRSFQVLATWYKRRSGVNLPLARCEMTELADEFAELYAEEPSPGIPLRGEVGIGWDIPDDIPDEVEIRRALGPMRRGKAPGPSGIRVDHLKDWAASFEKGTSLENEGMEIPEDVQEGALHWFLVVGLVQDIFRLGRVPTAFRHSTLVLVPKQERTKYRGIALLEVVYKLCSSVINRRLNKILGGIKESTDSGWGEGVRRPLSTANSWRRRHGLKGRYSSMSS